MKTGSIHVGELNGVNVIQMLGDVRLTLCLSFDAFIESMLNRENFSSVVFDLTRAEAIDSTTLGLMAKISIMGRKLGYEDPIVISSNPGITRLLVTMGFDDIFNIVNQSSLELDDSSILTLNGEDQTAIKEKVLEAHKTLSLLNDQNEESFKELISTLESYQ